MNSSHIVGFMSGGKGAKLDSWASLAILVHLVMVVATVSYLTDAITLDTWMVLFLVFLSFTLIKYFTTFNKHSMEESGGEAKSSRAKVVIDVEKGA